MLLFDDAPETPKPLSVSELSAQIKDLVEAGFPSLAAEDWAGLLVKKGTPPEVITRLNEAINKALKTDKVRDALAKKERARADFVDHDVRLGRNDRSRLLESLR